MKKVLLIAAAVALVAAQASALTIVNSKHDLAAEGGVNEICVYCHTPHAANTAISTAPLWNRTTWTDPGLTKYSSGTYNGGTQTLTGNSNLCMSCHDGTVAAAEIVNVPGTATFTDYSTAGNWRIGADAQQLSNDHPVGFAYAQSIASGDAELVAEATVAAGGYLFGGNVECASCHDVHNNQFAPFLRVSNTGSVLCLTCHAK